MLVCQSGLPVACGGDSGRVDSAIGVSKVGCSLKPRPEGALRCTPMRGTLATDVYRMGVYLPGYTSHKRAFRRHASYRNVYTGCVSYRGASHGIYISGTYIL